MPFQTSAQPRIVCQLSQQPHTFPFGVCEHEDKKHVGEGKSSAPLPCLRSDIWQGFRNHWLQMHLLWQVLPVWCQTRHLPVLKITSLRPAQVCTSQHPAEGIPSLQFRHILKDRRATRTTKTNLHSVKKLSFSLITANPKYEIHD